MEPILTNPKVAQIMYTQLCLSVGDFIQEIVLIGPILLTLCTVYAQVSKKYHRGANTVEIFHSRKWADLLSIWAK